MCLVGVVVRRYIDFLIIITYPTPLVYVLFLQQLAIYSSCVTVDYVYWYKIRIASCPAVYCVRRACTRLSAIFLFFKGNIY